MFKQGHFSFILAVWLAMPASAAALIASTAGPRITLQERQTGSTASGLL